MNNETCHLQLRLTRETRQEIAEIASIRGLKAADIVRGALYYGLPIVTAMADLEMELMQRLARVLKKESQYKNGNRGLKSDC
jgi:hypothetical protein